MSVNVWGFGKLGQLGTGHTDDCYTPVIPRLPRKVSEAVCVGSGGYYTAIVTKDGDLYTFGCGKHGRLGTGDETDRPEPVKITVKSDTGNVRFKQVSCGIWHGAAISVDNDVYIWGYGKSHGVLGGPDSPTLGSPSLLIGPFSGKVAGVSCGNNFTLLWTTDGEAYSWGCGRHGALGFKDTNDKHSPTLITNLNYDDIKITHMDAGFAHCGAVDDAGRVYMWGKSIDGALGVGTNPPKQVNAPTIIETLANENIKEISCNVGEKHGHTLFVTEDGKVYSCGDGYKGKLGMGDQDSRFTPNLIAAEYFNGETVSHVSSGGIHSAAVTNQGHVFTWGCGSNGRLGHPDGKGHRYLFRSDIPRQVDYLTSCGAAVTVNCSYYHTVSLVQPSTDK